MHTECLGVFAKHWTPGRVKTRLAAAIGSEAAASVYREFLRTTLARMSRIDADLALAVDPADSIPIVSSVATSDWQLEGQSDGDLGERLHRFFDDKFASGYRRVVLLGADSPHVPLALVSGAFDALRKTDVVLGPSEDGGYYLIGAADATPPVFRDIAWSSNQVFAATVEILEESNRRFEVLPQWFDVDEINELRRLVTDLSAASATDNELARLVDAILPWLPS